MNGLGMMNEENNLLVSMILNQDLSEHETNYWKFILKINLFWDVYKRQVQWLGGDVEDPKEPPKEPHWKNTYPMLVLPLRKIFVPSLVEIGPVV